MTSLKCSKFLSSRFPGLFVAQYSGPHQLPGSFQQCLCLSTVTVVVQSLPIGHMHHSVLFKVICHCLTQTHGQLLQDVFSVLPLVNMHAITVPHPTCHTHGKYSDGVLCKCCEAVSLKAFQSAILALTRAVRGPHDQAGSFMRVQ